MKWIFIAFGAIWMMGGGLGVGLSFGHVNDKRDMKKREYQKNGETTKRDQIKQNKPKLSVMLQKIEKVVQSMVRYMFWGF